jgi:UDP-glucuronate 4-epimerase
MKILVTGAAGFIGFHTCIQLLKEHHVVIGIDNLNDYYEIHLKLDRLKELGISLNDDLRILQIVESRIYTEFQFINLDITHSDQILSLMRKVKFDLVLHLAAQAGVRYSIENLGAYIQANISGFYSIIEGCRRAGISKIVYASSSSVYGNTKEIPFHEGQQVDHPVSLYAATKKCNELVAHTYSHLYNISAIGLRFFTVYGPWGRPDMAPFLFSDAILKGNPIKVFNNGDLIRDFTYVSDIVNGIIAVIKKPFNRENIAYLKLEIAVLLNWEYLYP